MLCFVDEAQVLLNQDVLVSSGRVESATMVSEHPSAYWAVVKGSFLVR